MAFLASDADRKETYPKNAEDEESVAKDAVASKDESEAKVKELERQNIGTGQAETSAIAAEVKINSSAQSVQAEESVSGEMEVSNITSSKQQEEDAKVTPGEGMEVSEVITEGYVRAESQPEMIQGGTGLKTQSSTEQKEELYLMDPISITSKESPGQPTIKPNSASQPCLVTTGESSVGTINTCVEQEPSHRGRKEELSSNIVRECNEKDEQADKVVQRYQTAEAQETQHVTPRSHTTGVLEHGKGESLQVQKGENVRDFSVEDQPGMEKEPASNPKPVLKAADPVEVLEEGKVKIASEEKKPITLAPDQVSQGENEIINSTERTKEQITADGVEKNEESEEILAQKDKIKGTLTEEQKESSMMVNWETKRVDLLEKTLEDTAKTPCPTESNVPTSLHGALKLQPSSTGNPDEVTTTLKETPHHEFVSRDDSEKQAAISTLEEVPHKTEEAMEVDLSNERLRVFQGSPMEDLNKDLPPQNFKPFSSYTLEGRLKESAYMEPPAETRQGLSGEVSSHSILSTSQDVSVDQRESESSRGCPESAKFHGEFLNFLKCSDNATEHSIKNASETLQSSDSRDLVENGEEKPGIASTDCNTNAPKVSKDNADTTKSTTDSNQESVSKPDMIDESSNLSSQSERKTRRRRGKKEVEKIVEEGAEAATEEKSEIKAKESGFAAEKLFEYQWPQDKMGEWFFLQEHLSAYLGIISFKRKYPDLQRRPVVMDERNFLMESGVVSEMQCDLGLTALKSDQVYEFMLKDFPEKYQAYAEVLHAREKQRLSDKNKAYGEMAKMDKNKIEDLVKKAVRNAAEFNAQFMRERREERGAYFDLQTHELHYPLSTIKKLPPEATKISAYPVALIPGQFQEYHKRYTPQQLKYFPLMTATYDPPRRLKTIFADPADKYESELESQSASSQDEAEDGSGSSSGSSSGSNSEGESNSSSSSEDETDAPTPAPSSTKKTPRTPRGKKFVMPVAEMTCREAAAMCNICQGSADKNKIGEAEELVKCSECGRHGHPSCLELTEEMIPMIKIYPWQCMECKTCVECMDPYDEDKMMFCDHCDRGYHTFCVGLRSIPTGRWECPSCRPEIPAKKRKK